MTYKKNNLVLSAGLRGLALFLAAAALAWGCQSVPRPEPRSAQAPVQILSINDFHGQVAPGQKAEGRPVGSAPVLAAYMKKAQQDFGGFTFFASAGDLVGASPPESALLMDEPAIMFMNLMGNDKCSAGDRLNPACNVVATLGNHEFDETLSELKRLVEGGNHPKGPFLQDPWPGAAFPYVAANVVKKDTGRPIFPPYVVKDADGVPMAFIGAVLKETKNMVMPTHVAGLDFLDEAQAINSYIPELKAKGVRTVIVLLHQGGRQEVYQGPTRPGDEVAGAIKRVVWRLDDEVDVVISGHTHCFTNALLKNERGKDILVTQSWSAGRGFADIRLQIDRQTRDVASKSATLVTAWADAGPGLSPDPKAAQLMQAAEQKVAPLTRRKVATATHDITKEPNPAGESPWGTSSPTPSERPWARISPWSIRGASGLPWAKERLPGGGFTRCSPSITA